MPQLLVRKVDEDLVRAAQAARRQGRTQRRGRASADSRRGAAARQAELRRARSPAPGSVARPRAQRQRRADQRGSRSGLRQRMVVDASVAVKWVVPEDGSEAAIDLLGRELCGAFALARRSRQRAAHESSARRDHRGRGATAGPGPRGRTGRTDRAPDPAAERDADGGRAWPLHLRLLLSGGGIAPDTTLVTADRRFAAKVAGHPYLAARIRLWRSVLKSPATASAACGRLLAYFTACS